MRTSKLNSPSRLAWSLAIAFAIVLFTIVPEVHAQGGALPAQAPVGATLVSPSGAIGTNYNPTYSLNKVSDATWYYLWVSRVNSDNSLTTVHTRWYDSSLVCSASTCSITPAGVTLSGGNYRWWIQTYNDAGYGPWSSKMDFSVATPTPPGVATLSSPSGATTDTTPTYSWNTVIGASWYYLWVSKVNDDNSLTTVHTKWYDASLVCSGGTCSITPAGVTLSGGNYRWWIQTWNDGGYGPWSNLMNFSLPVIPPPGVATLVSPNGATTDTTPTYTWNKVIDATWYYLWVSSVNSDGSMTAIHSQWYDTSVCSGATCSITPAGVLIGGAYKWWIQTWNDGGYGPWSATMNFSLPIPWPAQPTLISPSGLITDITPTYTWNAVSSETGDPATWYEVNAPGPGFQGYLWYQASSVCSGGTCSIPSEVTLASGSTYTWRVRGSNSAGNGPWSNEMSFTVASAQSFNSQFNGSSTGWESQTGIWSITNDSWFTATGSLDLAKSVSYGATYANFDYTARLQRIGCVMCDNYLYVRGTPEPMNFYGFWRQGYQFTYANDGYFSVSKVVNGIWYELQDYIYTSAVVPGGWNTLQVVANGSNLSYYINGTLVWAGSDTSITSGLVALAMDNFENSVTPGDKLLVDWAILNNYANQYRSVIQDTVSPEQQALNDAAGAGETDNSFRRKPLRIIP